MIECSVNNLIKYYGANKIFENISFELKTKERIGLIGQNGCGKTTLMKILMNVEDYQGGSISFRKGIKVGYLDQIFQYNQDTIVIEVLESAFGEIWNIKKEMKNIEITLKDLQGEALDIAMKNYGSLMESYELQGGYEVEARINKVCQGLKIIDAYREMEFEKLSGGEKTRVMLAKLLLEEPDILLMDEPTNHLDINSIEWLENFLHAYNGTVLVISHDRCFLDRIANKIIELSPTSANLYYGNYSDYVIEKERRFLLEYKLYQNQQKKIDQMENQIERYRIWGAMRDSDKMYKRAKELEKRLEKIDVLDRPTLENNKIRLSQQDLQRSGKIVLKVERLLKAFGEKTLFIDTSFTVFYQDRLCIMGDNGSGKTTLLRMILEEVSLDGGHISLGASVKLGYLPQNIVFDDEEMTLLEYFMHQHKVTIGEARAELAKVLFIKDHVYKKIKNLSGGEKSRLKLCTLLYEKVNFMILDEPTNHLDIDSREVLENMLLGYDGTIVFVSHDRYFIQKVANKIMVLKDHNVRLYPMPYNDYLEEIQKELVDEPMEEKVKVPKKVIEKPIKKIDKSSQLAKLEKNMEELEEQLKQVEKLMVLNNTKADRLNELFIEKKQLEEKFEEIFIVWEKLLEEK
ncbi:ABC-F type ribosomal protection protein [Tissierella sp. MSJ-40]|uniref:ABC-F type ribosomal protection protein n=1 Tax=Tissierella simiarum TaxID=2841534 RepID=A0ABS6E3F5_9FIRM|nr:ABC-F type ribosomal protection protein [Tissierella simiarum]MBU5437307.1 ABC-F type ribosomal protection protein [Tissierella simiarum]